jgi:hypothetical protein
VNMLMCACQQVYAPTRCARGPQLMCREGAAVRSTQRHLIVGLALTMAPIGFVVTAPPAVADCNDVGGTTVCSQGTVRGPDGVPRASTPVVPYACEYDWYCGSDSDIDISRPPGGGGGGGIDIGRPGRPGNRPG